MTDVLETYNHVLKNMVRLGEALPVLLRDVVFPDQPLKMAARDLAAEVRALRECLRDLVQSREAGIGFIPLGDCSYCRQYGTVLFGTEHGQYCPIRKGRALLGIPAEGIEDNGGTD